MENYDYINKSLNHGLSQNLDRTDTEMDRN